MYPTPRGGIISLTPCKIIILSNKRIDGTDHTHEHALATCASLERVWQHLAPCMLPFKPDNTPIRTVHEMLTVHRADLLSHLRGLVAWSAVMANWHTVCSVRKAPALDAWHTFLKNRHQVLSSRHG